MIFSLLLNYSLISRFQLSHTQLLLAPLTLIFTFLYLSTYPRYSLNPMKSYHAIIQALNRWEVRMMNKVSRDKHIKGFILQKYNALDLTI